MELKEGMYVRTKDGDMFILDKIEDNHLIPRYVHIPYIIIEEDVIKASYNIIDLIEVGDYVNGKKVIDTFTDYIFDYSEDFKVIRFSETDILHDVKHIKSIVTKEMFSNVEYRVETD